MLNDYGYIEKAIANIREVAEKQEDNIKAAAKLMADAIADDKLINVYAGGGHTTLAMGEMFFRAGGLANINPLMETALSVFNQALKYLELERTVNFGASIMKYYDLQKDDITGEVGYIGLNAVLGELSNANNALAEKYNARTDAGIGRDAEKGGETTASLRKSVAEMVTDILATVNALDRVMPSDATAAAVTSLSALVSQFKTIASQGGKRHEEPEPVPPNNA
jgi:uncharacterized phosphosugar-binding protein